MSSRMRLAIKNRKFQFCLVVVVAFIVVAVVGPYFTADPNEFVGPRYQPPSSKYPLGTDALGRDVLAQLVMGLRNSLWVAVLAGIFGMIIALVIGGFGAYAGGFLDEGLNTLSNLFLVLPTIPILIILSVLFEYRTLFLVAGIISLTNWPGSARAIRAQVLSLKRRNMVKLARLSGKGKIRIIFEEIFPNMLSYIFILFCGMLGGAMISEAGISLIGLGPTTTVTLGLMLHRAIVNQALYMKAWWWLIPPGLLLVSFTAALIVMGSVIDELLNPKMIPKYE